ncbi:MAG: response regulator [Desulfomonile tiedjei]|nr:response regulator [Desulfomonile tiedjei]
MTATGTPVRILLVEDNEDHAEVVRRGLKCHGMSNDIRHVLDGSVALDYLLRRGEYEDPQKSPRPHVILLDLRLPKVDGLEVLKEIKEHAELRRIPVVVLTSSQAESDVAVAYDHHVNSYLVKPLHFKQFTELLRDLASYWLEWNVNPFVQDTSD